MSNFQTYDNSESDIKLGLDLSNYSKKSDLKNAASVDTLQFSKKDDLASLKLEIDKLGIDKLEITPAGSDFSRNIEVFCVDNTSSSHADNRPNNFLVLDEGLSDSTNDSIGGAEKKSTDFSNAKTKFSLRLYYNRVNGCLHVSETEIYKFKGHDKISWCEFCSGRISKDFTKDEQSEIFINGTVYDFTVDHSSIQREDILNIHEYLMVKNNIK